MTPSAHTRIFLASLLAVSTAHAQLPGAPEANVGAAQPEVLKHVGFDQKLDAQIPLDLKFKDEAGKTVNLADFIKDKPVILSFAYYECPMLCTLVLNGMSEMCKNLPLKLGEDYQVITVGIDPGETHILAGKKKASYTKEYGIPGMETGWHYLTATEGPARTLADTVGFKYEYDPVSDQYGHASGIMVLTPAGRVSHYFYGIEYSPRDVRMALVEASDGKIGSPVDQLLMLCFHYDPVTGKYSAAIMNIIRLGCVVTLLTIGAFFWAMHRISRISPLVSQPALNKAAQG